ncbi:hypothetical protein [Chryseobacterium caseinilyticum]|uniref:DUF4292 domain-containing protein n=1 Tax=Chryseobacterium caseinilyticum TaxID=2771428 RepID=A0ABR8ZE86_9FLAO|nr:hypothetical protein [Chryseobacterium caseinilyticum]MBD8083586.1 hypothetical protein [Chryseobacterium caseinilyticum]
MRRFLLLSFLYSSFLLLIFSCRTYHLADAKPIENSEKVVENLYFSSNEDYVYKCQMEVYGNDISGILIIKKISETTHRVVMTSDFGNKMIDFEISENDFKLNYVLADLDKKMVINFLKNDFQELLRQKYPVAESFKNDNSNIFRSELNTKNYYLYFNKENSLLTQIVYTKNRKEKINFSFEAKKPTFAEAIHLEHKDFKINIKLFQITETE